MSEKICPCGSGLALADCCALYHEGKKAPTAEAVVRSRYTAFCLGLYDYLVQTTHPDFREDLTAEEIAQNTADIKWERLDILECGKTPASDGGEDFETVTFSVLYERDGRVFQMSEVSYFQRKDDTLYYVEGLAHKPVGYRRPEPKVGRNDPCPCGSGKKHKKCCAAKDGAA